MIILRNKKNISYFFENISENDYLLDDFFKYNTLGKNDEVINLSK